MLSHVYFHLVLINCITLVPCFKGQPQNNNNYNVPAFFEKKTLVRLFRPLRCLLFEAVVSGAQDSNGSSRTRDGDRQEEPSAPGASSFETAASK